MNKTDDIQKLSEDADESEPRAHVLSNTTWLKIATTGGALLVGIIVFVLIVWRRWDRPGQIHE
jgi:ABC-type Fe3+ transport system permease subunit